jgi:hypothetical protein
MQGNITDNSKNREEEVATTSAVRITSVSARSPSSSLRNLRIASTRARAPSQPWHMAIKPPCPPASRQAHPQAGKPAVQAGVRLVCGQPSRHVDTPPTAAVSRHHSG